MTSKKADMLLILCSILGAYGIVANKIVIDMGYAPFFVVSVRMLTSTVFVLIYFIKSLKTITKNDIIAGFIAGIFCFGGFEFMLLSYQFVVPSVVGFVVATNVIFVPIMSAIFLKNKVDIYSITGAIMVFIASVILSVTDEFSFSIGVIVPLGAAICFSAQIILIDYFIKRKDANPTNMSIIIQCTAFVLSTLFALATVRNSIAISPKMLAVTASIGIFATGLYAVLCNNAQKYTTAVKTSIITSTQAIFAVFFSVLMFSYKMTMQEGIAFIIMVLAVVISETKLVFLKKKKIE